jgi:hypothetical protein
MKIIRNVGLVLLSLPCFVLLAAGISLGLTGKLATWTAMRGFDALVLIFRDP